MQEYWSIFYSISTIVCITGVLVYSLWKLGNVALNAVILVLHVFSTTMLHMLDKLITARLEKPSILNKLMIVHTTIINCVVIITLSARKSVTSSLTPGWGKILSVTGIIILVCLFLIICTKFALGWKKNEYTVDSRNIVVYINEIKTRTNDIITNSIGVAFTLLIVSINLEIQSSSINDNLLTGTVALMFGGIWQVIDTILLEPVQDFDLQDRRLRRSAISLPTIRRTTY